MSAGCCTAPQAARQSTAGATQPRCARRRSGIGVEKPMASTLRSDGSAPAVIRLAEPRALPDFRGGSGCENQQALRPLNASFRHQFQKGLPGFILQQVGQMGGGYMADWAASPRVNSPARLSVI